MFAIMDDRKSKSAAMDGCFLIFASTDECKTLCGQDGRLMIFAIMDERKKQICSHGSLLRDLRDQGRALTTRNTT